MKKYTSLIVDDFFQINNGTQIYTLFVFHWLIYFYLLFQIFKYKNLDKIHLYKILVKIDKLAEYNKDFEKNMLKLSEWIIEKDFSKSFAGLYSKVLELNQFIIKKSKLFSIWESLQYMASLKNIVNSNIDNYIKIFDEVLELIERNVDNVYMENSLEKVEKYVLELKAMKANLKLIKEYPLGIERSIRNSKSTTSPANSYTYFTQKSERLIKQIDSFQSELKALEDYYFKAKVAAN